MYTWLLHKGTHNIFLPLSINNTMCVCVSFIIIGFLFLKVCFKNSDNQFFVIAGNITSSHRLKQYLRHNNMLRKI